MSLPLWESGSGGGVLRISSRHEAQPIPGCKLRQVLVRDTERASDSSSIDCRIAGEAADDLSSLCVCEEGSSSAESRSNGLAVNPLVPLFLEFDPLRCQQPGPYAVLVIVLEPIDQTPGRHRQRAFRTDVQSASQRNADFIPHVLRVLPRTVEPRNEGIDILARAPRILGPMRTRGLCGSAEQGAPITGAGRLHKTAHGCTHCGPLVVPLSGIEAIPTYRANTRNFPSLVSDLAS